MGSSIGMQLGGSVARWQLSQAQARYVEAKDAVSGSCRADARTTPTPGLNKLKPQGVDAGVPMHVDNRHH